MCEEVRDHSVVTRSLSFYHVGPRHQTQVVRLGGELFHSLHHLGIRKMEVKYKSRHLMKYRCPGLKK